MDGTCIARVASAFVPTDAHGDYSGIETVDVQWSSQGLSAIFKLYSGSEAAAPRAHIQILFLPAASLHIPTSPQAASIVAEKILEGELCDYHGDSRSPWLFASTQSGNYKAVIVRDDFAESHDAPSRSHASLHLLQFDGNLESPSVQDHRMELPSYIDLLEIYDIAMDERRGVLYLSHGLGHLFTIPYV